MTCQENYLITQKTDILLKFKLRQTQLLCLHVKFLWKLNYKNYIYWIAMRVMSVRPNYGPSCGGTLISLLGTGFTDTSK